MSFSYIYSSLHSFAKLFSFQACRSALEHYCESYCVKTAEKQLSDGIAPQLQGVREEKGHVQLGFHTRR